MATLRGWIARRIGFFARILISGGILAYLAFRVEWAGLAGRVGSAGAGRVRYAQRPRGGRGHGHGR